MDEGPLLIRNLPPQTGVRGHKRAHGGPEGRAGSRGLLDRRSSRQIHIGAVHRSLRGRPRRAWDRARACAANPAGGRPSRHFPVRSTTASRRIMALPGGLDAVQGRPAAPAHHRQHHTGGRHSTTTVLRLCDAAS